MSEEEIKLDRYAKFRKLGQFREWVVRGGDWRGAQAERDAVSEVHLALGSRVVLTSLAVVIMISSHLSHALPSPGGGRPHEGRHLGCI